MEITIHHEITLRFDDNLRHMVAHLLMTPRSGPTQTVKSWSVDMPGINGAASFTDPFGNIAHLVSLNPPPNPVAVTVRGVVECARGNGVVGKLAEDPQAIVFTRVTPDTRSPATMHGKYRHAEAGGTARLDILHGLMARVHEHFADSEEPADAREYAHSFIGAARALGIPARFVRGYLMDEDSGVVDSHDWAEAYTDALGWIGFDPVLDICPTEYHVRVAVGLDAATALPVRTSPEPVDETHDETPEETATGMTQSQSQG